jgi:two-component system, LytTR family, response regulator
VRVLIVDDEPAARRRLALMLEELDVEVAGEAANGLDALERVRALRPDVVLLDIAMPEIDGLDVARHLEDPAPLIIFQTAYDEYALAAFAHAAVDYLVKPVSLDRLERALGRARERLAAAGASARDELLTPDVIEALRTAVHRPVHVPRLLVRDRGGHRLVAWTDIRRFTTEQGGVYADLVDARLLTDYTMAELERRAGAGFVRANRGDLVNVEHVVRIMSHPEGTGELELTGGVRVPVSRRRLSDVRRALEAG